MKKLLTKKEIEFLANIYFKLTQNQTFSQCSKLFQDLVKEHCEEDIAFFMNLETLKKRREND